MRQNRLPRTTPNTRHNARCSIRPISRITAFQMSESGHKRSFGTATKKVCSWV
jgi:hypothetical protein